MGANESNIIAWTEVLDELRRLAGAAEQTRIVPNLIVIDAAPAGLTGYIIVRNEQGVYSPVLKLPSTAYANNDYVNVLYMKGTQPVALSQGSASPSVAIKVYELWESDFGSVVVSVDAAGNVTVNSAQADRDFSIGWDSGTALSIDGATGVITFGQPARAARIYNSAVQAIVTATNTKITFDTVRRDDGGLADLANDRLVAQVAGWYVISAGFGFAANATGNRGGELMVNGTIEIAQQFYEAPAVGVAVMSITAVYYLAATDYVELFGFQTSGGNLNTHQVGNKDPELAMALLK